MKEKQNNTIQYAAQTASADAAVENSALKEQR